MDGFEQVSAEAGSGQNDSVSASEASPNGNATDGAFLARTKKWREEALRHPDDQLACIGAVNSGAARILNAHWFAIEHAIETCKKSLLEEPSIQGAIVAYTGLLRQLHSMMSFQARLEQKRLDAEKREVQRELDPLLRRAR
jgi:hypothetical protein